jgi:hypothetical protein
MNAIGMYVPPLLVFPRSNMKAEFLDGAPPSSIAACHKAGWIQKESFTQWFKHFVRYVKPSKDDLFILTLGGHYYHTRNIEVIDFARENGVIVFCLPPHSNHKLQPLDISFMQPLKTYYAQEIEIWLKSHPNRLVTHYQIAGLVGKAYLKSATAAIAANGFRKTSLFPCNRYIFHEHYFLEESQRNIMSCLLENLCHVQALQKTRLTLAAQIHRQLPALSLRLPHKTLLLFCPLILVLFQTSLAENMKNQKFVACVRGHNRNRLRRESVFVLLEEG